MVGGMQVDTRNRNKKHIALLIGFTFAGCVLAYVLAYVVGPLLVVTGGGQNLTQIKYGHGLATTGLWVRCLIGVVCVFPAIRRSWRWWSVPAFTVSAVVVLWIAGSILMNIGL